MPARKKETDTNKTKKTTTSKRGSKKVAQEASSKPGAEAAVTQDAPKAKTTTRKKAPAKSAGASSGPNLVIVESPAKAKTIQKYLGTGFEVTASYGHVRDLPPKPRGNNIGIDIEGGWIPTYVNLDDERHKKIMADLKKRSAKANMVYLAPDPDREGEAIAWHLKEALKLSDDRIRRVTFNEITKQAIQDAFREPGSINMDLVHAQEARRFLDRAVGYKLSPLLRKKIGKGLSAGRVQSVAVRLIVEREREIEVFKPEEYWKIIAHLSPEELKAKKAVQVAIVKKSEEENNAEDEKDEEEGKTETVTETPALKPEDGKTFLAELAEWNGEKFKAGNEETATKIAKALEAADYVVRKVEQKDRAEKPQAPFTTSTLQQQASIRLRKSAKDTMRIAQQLYEGVELGSEGAVGLITYMRTDSTRVSNEALKSCRDLILDQFGEKYLPEKPNNYASGKSAQEAHEAIRPTDVSYTPERVAPYLNENQRQVYELIYRRFVASQMKPAIFAVTNVEIEADKGLFKAQGKILKFDGYRRVLAPKGKQEDATLPPLSEKQKLSLLDLLASQHFTQPPPRYNEASLVKALEKEGIGRPSTYASILEKIKERRYVELIQRRFHATKLGMLVTDKLVDHFPKVMDLKFTSQMERDLDQIESQETQWRKVLDDFWGPFSQSLELAKEQMETVREKESGENCPQCGKPLVYRYSPKVKTTELLGCSGFPECKYSRTSDGQELNTQAEETDQVCPTCGKPMVKKTGQKGPFLSCSGYPECKTTMNFDAEGKPVIASKETEHKCDKCGKPMVLRQGPRGQFLGCSGYPKCRNLKEVDEHGNPVQPLDLGIKCEKCNAPMHVKRGPRGPFLGCSSYPKCRSTKKIPPELQDKVKEMMPAPPPKAETPKVDIKETCPECGAPMELRKGRRGYFLGCTEYKKTKCSGTMPVPTEVLEQLQPSSV